MKSRKYQLETALMREALGAEDGIDSRQQCRTRARGKRNYHEEQVARQAERALSMVFSTSSDPILQELDVVSVSPFGNRLQIVVTQVAGEIIHRHDIDEALHYAAGHLRCAVGEAITRKRVPKLVFSVIDEREVSRV